MQSYVSMQKYRSHANKVKIHVLKCTLNVCLHDLSEYMLSGQISFVIRTSWNNMINFIKFSNIIQYSL